jgi:prostaglandin-endoperoxide synthase 2
MTHQRSTANDGRQNQLEFYLLTHFGPVWQFIQSVDWLRRKTNRFLINHAISKTATRPYPLSCMAPYTSWDSLTDRTYDGRHLPPVPGQDAGRPTPEAAAELFRREGELTLCPKSTVLFAYFAQWFTDGFLRSDRKEPRDLRKNRSNHNIDLSQLYGIDRSITDLLRAHRGGLLMSQEINGEEYPPFLCENGVRRPEFQDLPVAHFDQLSPERKNQLFAQGSDRANSQIGYVMMNVLFLREHNRIARRLAEAYPDWDDERLFQTARNILIVILIKIVIEEFINHIDPAYFQFLLDAEAFPNESWYRENWMAAEFNLLYRWHGLIPSSLLLAGEHVPVEKTLFDTQRITSRGLGAVMEDSSLQRAGRIGLFNTADFLMETELASIRMCRALELASYNDYRAACQFPRVTDFDQISGDPRTQAGLKRLYGDVDRIDYYVGIFAEDTRPNSILPALMGRLVAIDAFSQALTNPLLAPNVFNDKTFSPLGMEIIRTPQTLSDVLHRNTPNPARTYFVRMTRRDWKRV